MIRIIIELPNGPNNLNEIGNITTAALSANGVVHIENQMFIPAPSDSGQVPIIDADATPTPRIEDFAHTAANSLDNGSKSPKGR